MQKIIYLVNFDTKQKFRKLRVINEVRVSKLHI